MGLGSVEGRRPPDAAYPFRVFLSRRVRNSEGLATNARVDPTVARRTVVCTVGGRRGRVAAMAEEFWTTIE